MRTVHVCLSIRGALKWPKRDFARLAKGMVKPDGTRMTPTEARQALIDQLDLGREVLPVGDPCQGFDYVNGCPGHEEKESHHAAPVGC